MRREGGMGLTGAEVDEGVQIAYPRFEVGV